MRTILPRLLLALLVVLATGTFAAAESQSLAPIDSVKSSAVDQTATMPAATDETPALSDHSLIAAMPPTRDLLHLQGATPLVGVLLLVIAILPLFFGWRLLRLTLAIVMGYFFAIVAWEYGMPTLHHLMPSATTSALVPLLVVASVVSGLVGALLGWVLYQLELAVVGAALGAMVFAIPASFIDVQVLTWLLIAIGIVAGFIAGWVVAPYWAALQTAILGGVLVAQGILILTHAPAQGTPMQLVAYGIGLSAAVIGFVIQLLWIGRHALTNQAVTDRHHRPIVNT